MLTLTILEDKRRCFSVQGWQVNSYKFLLVLDHFEKPWPDPTGTKTGTSSVLKVNDIFFIWRVPKRPAPVDSWKQKS